MAVATIYIHSLPVAHNDVLVLIKILNGEQKKTTNAKKTIAMIAWEYDVVLNWYCMLRSMA